MRDIRYGCCSTFFFLLIAYFVFGSCNPPSNLTKQTATTMTTAIPKSATTVPNSETLISGSIGSNPAISQENMDRNKYLIDSYDGEANIRKAPTYDAPILRVLSNGVFVYVTEKVNDGEWGHVTDLTGKELGFVSMKLLQKDSAGLDKILSLQKHESAIRELWRLIETAELTSDRTLLNQTLHPKYGLFMIRTSQGVIPIVTHYNQRLEDFVMPSPIGKQCSVIRSAFPDCDIKTGWFHEECLFSNSPAVYLSNVVKLNDLDSELIRLVENLETQNQFLLFQSRDKYSADEYIFAQIDQHWYLIGIYQMVCGDV